MLKKQLGCVLATEGHVGNANPFHAWIQAADHFSPFWTQEMGLSYLDPPGVEILGKDPTSYQGAQLLKYQGAAVTLGYCILQAQPALRMKWITGSFQSK